MGRRRSLVLTALGVIAVVVAIVLVTSDRDGASDGAAAIPANTPSTGVETATTAQRAPDEETVELANRGPHEPLREIDGWLQSEVTSLQELRGKVVAVQFWTFGCSNCKATLPHMQALYERHGDDDFEIVGIHAPEFTFEEDPEAIAEAAVELDVTWPIALDTAKRTFFGWQGGRGFWPRIYLLDRDGNVRYDHIGEGAYEEIDAAVGSLLAERGQRADPG
jgi:thiol-disulfide isomerase/thioredoxin